MDALLSIVVLGLLAIALAVPVLALVAFLRSGPSGRLARRVDELERQLERLRTSGPAHAPEPAPEPELAQAAEIVADVEPVAPRTASAPPPPAPAVAAEPLELEPPAPEPAAPTPAPRPSSSFEWERWIGVRGAALLGGVLLALAGLLFYQYSVQRGWITPALRVSIGIVAGLAAIVGSYPLRGRGYRITADALAGAGAVLLYGATWAAYVLYGLVPLAPALVAMAAVTGAFGWMAQRHRSLPIALFGLLGGLATPLLLSLGAEHPLGLFGYLLLLDLGLVVLAGRLERGVLRLVGVLGTLLLQGLWMVRYLDAENLPLAMLAVAGCAAVFALSGRARADLASRAGALLLPLPFAAYFAARVELQAHLLPVGLLLAALLAGALWVARREAVAWLGEAAAAGASLSIAVWIVSSDLDGALAWELAGVAVALTGLVHLALALGRARGGEARAGVVAGLGLSVCLVLALGTAGALAPWPLLAGLVALALLGARLAARSQRPAWLLCGAPVVALGWLVHRIAAAQGVRDHLAPSAEALLVVLLAVTAALGALAFRRAASRAWALRAAALTALVLLLALDATEWGGAHVAQLPHLAAAVGLALTAVVCAGLTGSGALFAAAVALALLGHLPWIEAYVRADEGPAVVLALLALEVTVLTSWPLTVGRRLRASSLALGAALFAPLLAYPALLPAHEAALHGNLPGTLPLSLCLVLAYTTFRADADDTPADAFAAYAALAVVLGCFALPVEVGRATWLLGIALSTVGIAGLWRLLEHRHLRTLALVLAGATCLLVGRELIELLLDTSRYERSGYVVLHWFTYLFGLPAAALLLGARLLGGKPGKAVGLAGLALSFLWVNFEVVNAFSSGPVLTFGHDPTRDLVLSLAWACYAVALLALGVRRAAGGLRWVSLAVLLVTLAKVFLYDLGHLEGLFRVGSLIGLALSLLLVSLVYQRFVFRAELRPTRA